MPALRFPVLICVVATLLASAPLRASSLEQAMQEVRADRWEEAARTARPAGDVALAIVDWRRLRAGAAEFDEYVDFLEDYGDFPGLDLLRRRGELAIPRGADPLQVIGFFDDAPPETPLGSLRLIAALQATGQEKAAEAEAIRAWTGMSMTPGLEAEYLALYGPALAPHHVARMDELLWRGLTAEAERMRPRLDPGHRALMTARLGLRRDDPGVDLRIAAVPAALAGDPGLAWERMEWRARRGRDDDVLALMLERSATAETLGRPEYWAKRRQRVVRALIDQDRIREAYLAASQHHLTGGADFADLEWLAGYLALRRLDEPAAALAHFKALRAGVASPISLGRAGYWEGRAYEAMDQPAAAQAAYAFGAGYQTSFYGQLAAEKAGLPMDPGLTGEEDFGPPDPDGFIAGPAFAAGMLLHEAGEQMLAARFFAHIAEGLPRRQAGQLAAATEALGSPYVQLKIAKAAARSGTMLHRAYFPLIPISVEDRDGVETALALAIARRESEFDPQAVSPAGARGLMQVMPATASAMAGELKIAYSLPRLTADPAYNAELGTAYLARLRKIFGNSTLMVAAAYNAGPGRPLSWAERNGDPRDPVVDAIDWIEAIPFVETRNYVMRVLESIGPYRARLAGRPIPLTLTAELSAR